MFFFFKQKTAYEMRISDWSSDVCSSDLPDPGGADPSLGQPRHRQRPYRDRIPSGQLRSPAACPARCRRLGLGLSPAGGGVRPDAHRSEEHTSELQSLMRNSYAVFCLKKKKTTTNSSQ